MMPFGLAGSSHLTSAVLGLRDIALPFFGGVPGAKMIHYLDLKDQTLQIKTKILVIRHLD